MKASVGSLKTITFNILIGFILLAVVMKISSEYQLRREHSAISESMIRKLHCLKEMRPETISKAEWEFLVGWSIQCQANCLDTYGSASLEDFRTFNDEFETKLQQGELGYDFFDWFWDRVVLISKNGRSYSANYRPTSPERLKEAEEGIFGLHVK